MKIVQSRDRRDTDSRPPIRICCATSYCLLFSACAGGLLWICCAEGVDQRHLNVRSNAPKTLSQVATDEPDPSHLRIRLTGTNHHWVAEYLPSERGGAVLRSHFATGDFHIPVNTPVVLLLNSTDYMYALAIPDLHLKEIAVPELEFQMELPPLGCGRFPLVAGEMCGIPGLEPPGRLIVEPRAMFNQWLHDNEELTL